MNVSRVTPRKPPPKSSGENESWSVSLPRVVPFPKVYRRVVLLMALAVCGVLVGCNSSPVVSKHAPGPGPVLPITVHAGTLASWTSLIEAPVAIGEAGTYQYDLTYAHLPIQPGAAPQACLPESGFRLISGGTVSFLKPVLTASGTVTGSVELTAATWTAVSGFLGLEQLQGVMVPAPPDGSFWSGACPWSLTLTRSAP